jgi:hypothetical protein
MYGLYIDDVKGTCSPITDTMCVNYKKKKKNLLLFWAWKAGLLQFFCQEFPPKYINLQILNPEVYNYFIWIKNYLYLV